MMKLPNCWSLKTFICSSILLFTSFIDISAQIAVFNPTGLSNYGPTAWSPTSPPPTGATVGGMTRAAGVGTGGTAAGSAWGGSAWCQTTATDAITNNQYVYFTMQATAGYTMSLTTWNECYRRSGTGPANGLLQYSINAGPYTDITTLAFTSTSTSGACLSSVNLNSVAALQNVAAGNVITFRIVPYGATSSSGTWYIFQASGLSVTGTVTLTPSCSTPTGLAAASITTTTANLSWNTVAGAVNYEYIVDQSAATPAVPGTVTATTSYNATGLSPATTYYLHVRANCGASYSSWATAYSFTTLTPCPNPTGLTANNVTTTTANLSWNTVAGALNYEYIVDQNPATPAVPGTVTATASYNATGLSPSTTYYLHVRANCGTPNYSAWVTSSFTTLTPCPDPAGLAANNITTTSADLSWNTIVTALNYEYIVDQNPATPAVPGTVTTTASYNVVGLTPSTTYYLHVRANCGTPNYSAWVTSSFTTLTPCPDPAGLAANNITTTSADLSWNTIVTALNYEYIIDQNPATPVVPGTVTATTSYSAVGLIPSTTYYLHVRANCGTPNYSAWVTSSFITLTPCPDPTGLTASLVTDVSALLSWDSLLGPSYEYTIDQNPATPALPGTVITTTSYSATGFTASTTYYLHVRSNCGANNFSAWVTQPFTTMGTPANILVGWDVNGLSGYGPSPYNATTPPPATVAASGLLRGSNVTVPVSPAQATGNAWGGMAFYGSGGPYVANTQQDLIDNNAFLYFKINAQTGYTLSLSSFDMFFGRYSAASPQNVTIQYGIDSSNFVDLATNVHMGTPNNAYYCYPTLDLAGIANLQHVTSGHTVYFRIIPAFSANDTGAAAWYIYNGNNDPLLYNGADIFLKGSADAALSVELISFTGFAGHNDGDGNILTWVTNNEQNIKSFELERSLDGKIFNAITSVTAKGNTSTQSVYSYHDKGKIASHTFYRLKIVDNNGTYKYSDIVEINSAFNTGDLSIYPNPVHSKLYINTYDATGNYSVILTDVLGKTQDLNILGNAKQGTLNVDVSSLPNGAYMLQVTNNNSHTTRSIRFIKE